jgi:DHA1 family inner membrane transport protein
MSVATPQVVRAALLLPALFSVSVLAIVWLAALGPFYPAIAKELNTTVALVGQIATVSMLTATALGLVVGPLADQYGRRLVLVLGTLAVAVGAFGTALAPTFAVLLLAALAGALGNAILIPVAVSIAGEHFTGDARRGAISWVNSGGGIAAIVGVPLLTAIAARSNWRVAIAVLGLIAILVAVFACRAVPRDSARYGRQPANVNLLSVYLPLFRHVPTMQLFCMSVVRNGGLWCFYTYYGAYLIQELHLGFSAVGWAYASLGAGLFCGSRLAGGRIGKLSLRALLVWTTLLQAAFTGVVLLPLGAGVVVAALSVSLLLQGVYGVALSTLLLDGTPVGHATTMTLNQSANNLGIALGSVLGGAAIVAGGYHAAATLLQVLMCVAMACILWPALAPHLRALRSRQRPLPHQPPVALAPPDKPVVAEL